MFQRKILFLLNISLLSCFAILPANAADMSNKDPLWFVEKSDWLSYDDVKKLLQPNAFWCFEEENKSCLFFTIAKGEQENPNRVGKFFAYDIAELWEKDIILATPTGGVLRGDGKICEQGIDWIDNVSAYDLKGKPVSSEQLKEMKDELWRDWEIDKETQYCFSYARTNPGQPEVITQFYYIDGKFSGESMNFIVDYSKNAINNYQLRLN